MKGQSRQGLRRFQVEVWSYGNSYYIERIAELERVLARKPRALQIKIVGTGEISGGRRLAIPRGINGTFAQDANCHPCMFEPAGGLGAALAAGRLSNDS